MAILTNDGNEITEASLRFFYAQNLGSFAVGQSSTNYRKICRPLSLGLFLDYILFMTALIGKSSLLWNILTLSFGRWLLIEAGYAAQIQRGTKQRKCDVLDIKEIQYQRSFLWDSVFIVQEAGVVRLSGVEKQSACEKQLRKFIEGQVLGILSSTQESLNSCWEMCDGFLRSDIYLSTSLKESFVHDWRQKFDDQFFALLAKIENSSFLERSHPDVVSSLKKIHFVLDLRSHFYERIQQRNEDFVAKELHSYRQLFDGVERLPLTQEQRRAAVYFEDANLLVASAGSGKTSSLVGKAVYALKKNYFEPQEILMLAFAKDAANGLKDRFENALSKQSSELTIPNIKTFHSLGMGIIQAVEGIKPRLASWAGDDDLHKSLLSQLMDEVCQEPALEIDMVILVSTLMFGNATSYDQRVYYQELFRNQSDFQEMKVEIRDKNPSLKTLKGEMVRSLEELIIANWLSLHGINYRYEDKMTVEVLLDDGNSKTIEHNPDFYYPDIGVYHEHFALNKDGEAPSFMGGEDYLSRVIWKRTLFKDHNVNFFETHSSMFQDGRIFEVLKDSLHRFGLNPRAKMLESRNEEFVEGYTALMNIIATVLKHIRNQGRSSGSLDVKLFDSLSQSFHRLVVSVLRKYEELLVREKVLDYEEMLIKASAYVEQGAYRSPYRFICIDEFQDISQGRRRMVRALLDQKKGATLFAVGDDWQGIYRFAGADLDIFTRTMKYFGPTKELFLTNTFRSNQGIADVAALFVQKNPVQKKKAVLAHDKNRHRVLRILSYGREHEAVLAVEDQMQILAEDQRLKVGTAKVFILTRYNFLQPHRIKIREWERKYQGILEISTMSFHASKGQEADYVFILGMNGGPMGFPSMKYDHPFLQMYMSEADTFPFAEERRLFYVALTRAKKKVFFVNRKGIPSPFLQELRGLPDASVYFE